MKRSVCLRETPVFAYFKTRVESLQKIPILLFKLQTYNALATTTRKQREHIADHQYFLCISQNSGFQ